MLGLGAQHSSRPDVKMARGSHQATFLDHVKIFIIQNLSSLVSFLDPQLLQSKWHFYLSPRMAILAKMSLLWQGDWNR